VAGNAVEKIRRAKTKLIRPSDEENAAINRGIAADPDNLNKARAMQAFNPLAERHTASVDSSPFDI
jgi:hypothetical protein